MNGVNKVILVGTLGSDPKPMMSREGREYTSLSLATHRNWKNNEGVKTERTDWHRVTVWGKQGLLCREYLQKGAPVCVEGHITTFEVEDDGKKRRLSTITADDVNFLPRQRQAETHADARDDSPSETYGEIMGDSATA